MPSDGRHPFPTSEAFAGALGRLGIGLDDPVIGYDDSGGGTAGRLVWMLRIVGHPAALLDGGLHAARAARVRRRRHPAPRRRAGEPWPVERFADHDEVATAAQAGDAVVLDARSAPRFSGEDATIDPRPGHIPGAANVHWATNVDPVTCRFREDAELRELYAARGIDEAATSSATAAPGCPPAPTSSPSSASGSGTPVSTSRRGRAGPPTRPDRRRPAGVSPWSEQ